MDGFVSRHCSDFPPDFGFRHRPHINLKRGGLEPAVVKAVQTHGYDLTVFKVQWGNLTLKIYDKGGRVLRVEVVVHNAKELRCGKVLEKLPVLLERMRGMLAGAVFEHGAGGAREFSGSRGLRAVERTDAARHAAIGGH